jgi:cytochrome c oxidase assembly protein subunit 15
VTATLRALLWLALGLAFVVLGTSSALRLAADGLGCEPWPECYGRAGARDAAPAPAQQAVRVAHRVSASTFALAALAAVVLGWRLWKRPARVAGALVLAATAALAAVGRITPSGVPAVTLANALGALVLLGGTAFLIATRAHDAAVRRGRSIAGPAALALLLALQSATGLAISVRSAGAACSDGCAAGWPPGAHRLWHPLEPGSATGMTNSARAGETLHGVHRLFTIVLIVAAAGLAVRRGGKSLPLLASLGASMLSGAALAALDGPLGLAVFHALASGALAAAIGALLAAGPLQRETA